MIFKSDPQILYDHASDSFYAAVGDTLAHSKKFAPRLTGEYAESLRIKRRKRPSGPTARIGSRLPQAGAIERGAWVKSGRGPHISRANAPGKLEETGKAFQNFYPGRLRSTRIKGTF